MSYDVFAETDRQSEQMREAFSFLRPVRDDYPLIPIEDGFNWQACADGIDIPDLYLVVFRSVRRADADTAILKEYDDLAYEDARAAPGFLYYFRGQLTPERSCLSFCLWQSRAEARSASARTPHASAAGLVLRMYETYVLERHCLTKERGMLVFQRLTG